MSSGASPMQRSLAFLRDQGFVCDIVEHRVPRTFITRDLFNIFDILAIKPGRIVGVQTTTRANQAARRKKMQEAGHLSTWLAAGGVAELHGWAKTGRRGERKLWTVSVQEVVP